VQLLCLSPSALGSDWVQLERGTALFRDPSNAKRRFVPIILEDCRLPDTLRQYRYLDFRQDSDLAFEDLLAACRFTAENISVSSPAPERKTTSKVTPNSCEPTFAFKKELNVRISPYHLVTSPDLKWIVTADILARDVHCLEVVDISSGSRLALLENYFGSADFSGQAVCISSDGKRIISGVERMIHIWDARNYKLLTSMEGHKGRISEILPLPDSRYVLSASWDRTIRLWNIESGKWLRRMTGSLARIFSLAVSKDGSRALSGSSWGELRLWNIEAEKCLMALAAHWPRFVRSVQLMADGRHAASTATDEVIKVWDMERGICVSTLGGLGESERIAISPDGYLLASIGSPRNVVRIWDWGSGTCVQTIRMELDVFTCSVVFASDGSHLFVGATRVGRKRGASDRSIFVYGIHGPQKRPSG
jgi:hypothetical protein